MKVTKGCVHRLNVSMECTCSVGQEFSDSQYKIPEGERHFLACSKHLGQPGVDIVEMILGELLEKEVAEAQKAPVTPQHMYTPPGSQDIEEGDTGGVVATGGAVQSIMKVNKPVAVRPRTAAAPTIKTIQRSPEQLAKAGAAPVHAHIQEGAMEMGEVAEDTRYTPHIEEALDFLDERESGLLEDE